MTLLLNSIFIRTKLQVLSIATLILLLYFRTFSYDFIGLDEQSLLEDKRAFNKELSNIPKAFRQHVFQIGDRVSSPGSSKYYRPILTVSFILDQQFSGTGFAFYRFTNMLIHFLACIGLLFVLQQLKIPHPLAFFFSLLFAAHPLLVQAVAWIPGRNDSLACVFVLWSFYFLATATSPKSSPRERTLNIVWHLLLFACALFTKENAIVFIVICAYYIFLIQKHKFPQQVLPDIYSCLFLLSCRSCIFFVC